MDSKSLTKTSFCGKEIDNVTNNELKKHILDDMCQKTNITYKTRYAKMFNEQYLKNFNNPHIICLKTIGSPYLLYCTQINDVNYCFLIDKKIISKIDYKGGLNRISNIQKSAINYLLNINKLNRNLSSQKTIHGVGMDNNTIIEDLTKVDFRANGFPEELIDNEPEKKGYEI